MAKHKLRKTTVFASLISLLVLISASFFLVANFSGTVKQPPVHNQAHVTPTISKPSPTSTARIPPPIFADYFVDNSKGWYVGDVSGYTRTIKDNELTLIDSNHKILIESIPTSAMLTNFSLTVTFTLQQADPNDSVGLYLRGDSNLDHDYRIDIFGNTLYSISKEWLDSSNVQKTTFLAAPAHTPFLRPLGQKNTLTVTMKDATLTLLINGSVVSTISDPDYTRGQVALFVENGQTSQGVTATFESVLIEQVPDETAQ